MNLVCYHLITLSVQNGANLQIIDELNDKNATKNDSYLIKYKKRVDNLYYLYRQSAN